LVLALGQVLGQVLAWGLLLLLGASRRIVSVFSGRSVLLVADDRQVLHQDILLSFSNFLIRLDFLMHQ
jgi:hypothetical protein